MILASIHTSLNFVSPRLLYPIREYGIFLLCISSRSRCYAIFWQIHPDSERPLRAWYAAAKRAQWRGPTDIKEEHSTASFLGENRVIFNIKGNSYRLVVIAEYRKGRLFVRFVGTHAEYDRIDATRI